MSINTKQIIYFGYALALCNEDNVCHRSGISNDLDRLLPYLLGGDNQHTEHKLIVTISNLFNSDNDLFELEVIR